jgi:hypothetical protein
MKLGIVMLVHTAFGRAEQVIRHWVSGGCPVVVHVDSVVSPADFEAFVARFTGDKMVLFASRFRCEWGTWGLVAATQAATEMLLDGFPDVSHVFLASGSCLPLRPVRELVAYLDERPETDFIESARIADVPWTVGGLSEERFTLSFPFSWRKHRRIFDHFVRLQRILRLKRRLPEGIEPHMGSQWWCLTRKTLDAILTDPARPAYDRFFRLVWIPDESYFQTLVRRHATMIESRSLTLSKFDFQGRPHIFYDDHLQLLRRSDCFVARKIWQNADGLYRQFLSIEATGLATRPPNPSRIDRLFARAVQQRTQGRSGLVMQSRFPNRESETELTAGPYMVFQGFSELHEGFEEWLAEQTGACVHGHLFSGSGVEFTGRVPAFSGCLSDSGSLRDHNPEAFLRNLIWNTRGVMQIFQFAPQDNQEVIRMILRDRNAVIRLISGAWAVPLFLNGGEIAVLRTEAARLQQTEADLIRKLRSPLTKAGVRIWTMAEFLEKPGEIFEEALFAGSKKKERRYAFPKIVDLTGFGQFLQELRNLGMHPYLMGDFPIDLAVTSNENRKHKTYLVG